MQLICSCWNFFKDLEGQSFGEGYWVWNWFQGETKNQGLKKSYLQNAASQPALDLKPVVSSIGPSVLSPGLQLGLVKTLGR